MQYRCSYIGGGGGVGWGQGRAGVCDRCRLRWKLHPSNQAWPLLSTSTHGETAIAKMWELAEEQLTYQGI